MGRVQVFRFSIVGVVYRGRAVAFKGEIPSSPSVYANKVCLI